MTSPTPEPSQPGQSGQPVDVVGAEPSTRERLGWMARNSRRLIVAIVALLVAAVVVVFSFSLFSSTSANPGNMASTGIMEIGNSDEGQAILTAEGLLPGDTATGTVTIENIGDADGDFTLTASNFVDEPADPALSAALSLVINDGTAAIYDGSLAGLSTIDLGTWAPGDAATFTFTISFDLASGNEYQDARTTVDLTWDATQSTG